MLNLKRNLYQGVLDGINGYFDLYTGGQRRPVFFDIREICPQLLELDKHFPVIRQELLGLLPEKHLIPRYHELDRSQYRISGNQQDKDWKVFMLYAMGEKPEANRARCPRTSALLDKIPNLFQAFFSILDGGKSIPAHNGPYRGYLRYHLALIVPEKNPPTIRVKDRYHTWQEGKSVIFDDSWDHEVSNHSDGMRVVLIVDFLRPMPLPFDSVNRLFNMVVRQVYAKGMMEKMR
jgi:aspartyl/asparaginyl beta-hydroxylase (cupin superfamily)